MSDIINFSKLLLVHVVANLWRTFVQLQTFTFIQFRILGACTTSLVIESQNNIS